LERLCKRNRDCKGTKRNPSFGQTTGIQKKSVAKYEENASLVVLPRIIKKATDQEEEGTRRDQ